MLAVLYLGNEMNYGWFLFSSLSLLVQALTFFDC